MAALSPAVIMPELFPADPYGIDKAWRPRGHVWALEGTKGGPVREVGSPPNHDDYMGLEDEFFKRSIEFIRKRAEGDNPFFLALWPQLTSFLGFPDRVTASGGLLQEALARMDVRVGEIKAELEKLGTRLCLRLHREHCRRDGQGPVQAARRRWTTRSLGARVLRPVHRPA